MEANVAERRKEERKKHHRGVECATNIPLHSESTDNNYGVRGMQCIISLDVHLYLDKRHTSFHMVKRAEMQSVIHINTWYMTSPFFKTIHSIFIAIAVSIFWVHLIDLH